MENEAKVVQINQQFLPVNDYSKITRRSRASVYQDIAAGRIPVVRFGPRCLRIPAAFLERAASRALASTDTDGAEE
jgi:hypothetical protein